MRWLITLAILGTLAVCRAETTQPAQVSPVLAVILREDKPALVGQEIAQQRATYMAKYNYRGHPPKSKAGNWLAVPGAGFEGVGWRRSDTPHRKIGTCRPSGRSGAHDDNSRTLLGDAVAHSRYGSFRVRIWGKRGKR